MNEDHAGRRSFMRLLAGWWTWVVGFSGNPAPGWSATPPRELTRLAKLSDIPDGTVLRTLFRGEPLLLMNEGGKVRALSGLCTHESCELGWNDEQRLIQCPCHGSMFDASGQVVQGPATEALPTYRTQLRHGWVFVRTE